MIPGISTGGGGITGGNDDFGSDTFGADFGGFSYSESNFTDYLLPGAILAVVAIYFMGRK